MRTLSDRLRTFLVEVMQRRGRLPSQLASDIGVSHTTVLRWLDGEDTPSTQSCYKLGVYCGLPVETILKIAGHIPGDGEAPVPWQTEAPGHEAGRDALGIPGKLRKP